jgi:hypothetical protein
VIAVAAVVARVVAQAAAQVVAVQEVVVQVAMGTDVRAVIVKFPLTLWLETLFL